MEGATRQSTHMSRADATAWRDSVFKRFSEKLGTELPNKFARKFAGSENILSEYSGALEHATSDVWREIFFVAREPASRMSSFAESAAKELEECYSEMVGYAKEAVKQGDINVLSEKGYSTLLKAGEVVAHSREASAPYKVGMKEIEQERIEDYVLALLKEQESAHKPR